MSIEQEKGKEPAEQRSSAHTFPLAPYAIVSSTNSKAQAPNLNNAREAFPTASENEPKGLYTHHYGPTEEDEEPVIMAAWASDMSQNYVNLLQGRSFDGTRNVQTFSWHMDSIIAKLVVITPGFSSGMIVDYLRGF